MATPFFIPIRSTLKWPESREKFPEPGDIHIWKAALGGDEARLDGYYALLSEAEKGRADRLRVETARKRFISAHGILRILLGKYLGQQPAEIVLDAAPRGKPFLAGQSATGDKGIRFNMTHSGEWMLFSASRDFGTGIDLEYQDPKAEFEQISSHFFSDADHAWLDLRQPEDCKAAAFFRLWTCKEAVLKAEGSGIRLGMADVRIEFAEGEDSARGVLSRDQYKGRAWSINTFEPASGYAAALAYESSASAADHPKLLFFQWMG
jgi:4'-phosphopantetheinyl transferase